MGERVSARDYRQVALERLDVRSFFERHVGKLGPKVGADELRFLCPIHGDTNPSANVNLRTGLWKCQACGEGGSPIDLLMKKDGLEYKDALTEIGTFVGLDPPSTGRTRVNGADPSTPAGLMPAESRRPSRGLSEANVVAWHEAGLRNADLQRWFHEHRGYTDETIAARQLGWDGQRVTIPVRDPAGGLVNVRRYLRDSGGEKQKMLPLVPGTDKAVRLFPDVDPLPEQVILVEGEWDAILMHQEGFANTLTATGGAGTFKPEWAPRFEGRDVVICYDNDEGGFKGAQTVASRIAGVATVRILHIPNLPPKGDVTDFFVEQSRSPDELRDLLAAAAPYASSPVDVDEGEPSLTPLHQASDARHRGKRLELPVLLSGKSMTPYLVPYKFNVHCDMNNKRLCGICPLADYGGNRDVTLTASNPAVLSLVGVSDESQQKALKQLAEALPNCPRPQIDVKESINVEEVRLIPEIDARAEQGGDVEYVARTGYALMHGLLPNRGYRMRGYSHPHPKSQSTVHLLSEAIPAQDNISAFSLNAELVESLKIFRAPTGGVEARFRDIYEDLTANVHRIQDRFDMQVAYDLAWHSVIAFSFNGQPVRRGWVETMVMGDSGQGKTEMAMALLGHYRLGERVQGEQTSTAGLIGGLEKMGDTWLLSWGRLPLNDKRLLIIDEAQGLAQGIVEGASDVRATGVAEITKIRTERTNARCRLVWLANPIDGLTLAQHNQGVIAIQRLFSKPEDIRRLDFALCAASGDVDFAKSINVAHNAAGTPRYPADLCRQLVLWAWSRRPDQTVFTEAATEAILAAATMMGRRYHPSIPLVEPADQRLKIARLAAATAARVFSSSLDGEQLIILPEHVEFVVEYLERVYNSKAMSYGEYSDSMRGAEELPPDVVMAVQGEVRAWNSATAAMTFLRSTTRFKRQDLVEAVGWEDAYAKTQIAMMTRHRLIRSVRDGYVKQPGFIALLRELAAEGLPPQSLDELIEQKPDEAF
jgi:hypothetical protein